MDIVHYPHPALLAPTREVLPEEIPGMRDRIREMFEAETLSLMDMLLAKRRAAERRAWLEAKGDLAET